MTSLSHLYETRDIPSKRGNVTVCLTASFIEQIKRRLSLEQDDQLTDEQLQKYFGIEI